MTTSTKTALNTTSHVQALLGDVPGTRWPATTLHGYINEAQMIISSLRPDKVSTRSSMLLAVGETKQSAPTTVIKLLNVIRNMGTDGTTAGAAIRKVNQMTLDAYNPSWHTATEATTVTEWFPDASKKSTDFYVYPPAHSSTAMYVEIDAVSYPTAIADGTTVLSIPDELFPAVVDFTMYRALGSETELVDKEAALKYLTSFAGMLNVDAAAVQGAQ